jgi:ABC-type uncharacterized transport system permease subunit
MQNRVALAVGLLTLIPILIWATMEPLSSRFGSTALALKRVGQISALAGTVLFSAGIILRTKISIFGTDAIKNIRSKSELAALLLLLAHPIIIVTMLVPADGWALSFGIYALLLLIAYHAIQFCAGKNKYLAATPHVLSAVLFLGTLHAFFIPSSLSRNPVLQAYMLAIIGSAFLSYSYQVFASKRTAKYAKTASKSV